jgi:O-antigen/teichoic acid export membrane protein
MQVFTRLKSARFAHFLDFALVLGGTAFATGTGFLLKVLIGRNLGPGQLGTFGICFAFLTIVSMLADLGIRYSLVNLASRAVSEEKFDRARRLVAAGMVLKLVGGIVVALTGWYLAPAIAEHMLHKPQLSPFLQITAIGVLIWSLWDGLEGSLHVRQRFSWGAGCRIILEMLRLVAFVGLWGYAQGDYLSLDRFMWLYFATPIAALLIGFGMLKKLYTRGPNPTEGRLRKEELVELVAFSRGIFFYRSASVILLFMDSLMLTRYGELDQVGLFEAAKGLAFALLLVSESLQQVLLPKVNQIKTIQQIKDLVKKSGRYFAVLFVSAMVWMAVAAPFLGLFGEAFTQPGVGTTFYLMVMVTMFTIPSTIWSTVLLTLDQPMTLGCVASAQVILGLILYPLAIPMGGPIATAATALTLQVVGCLVYGGILYFEVKKREGKELTPGDKDGSS